MPPFTKMKKAPSRRATPEDAGLHDHETAFTLDTGAHVAIGVRHEWQPHDNSVTLFVSARAIREDGHSQRTDSDQRVLNEFSMNFDHPTVVQFGLSALASDLARMALGESPQLHRQILDENDDLVQHPVIDIPDAIHHGFNIRNALAVAQNVNLDLDL